MISGKRPRGGRAGAHEQCVFMLRVVFRLSYWVSLARTDTVVETFPAFSNVSVKGKLSPAESGFLSPNNMTW
jgi:hypothetical protein